MPSPTLAIDLIKTSLRMIGAIATGETPDAADTEDALRALNDVLERWSIEGLSVYGSLATPFMTIAGQSTYSFGPGGDLDSDRPQNIDSVYTTISGFDYPATEWTYEQYLSVSIKSQPGQLVERYVFINSDPLANLILWPTPSAAIPLVIDFPRLLAQVPTQSTMMYLPPGYVSALQYALSAELAPQYGSTIDLSARASAALALIKRANRKARIMGFDASLVRSNGIGSTFYGF